MILKHFFRFCCLILPISFGCDHDDDSKSPQNGYYVFGRLNLAAVYWKDGRPIDVDGFTAYFPDVAVSGSDVYAIGYVDDVTKYRGAAYWKNGKMFRLSNGNPNQVPIAIAFAGPDVYIAGFEDAADKSFAIYWKNGEVHVLSDKEGFARPTAIAVSGSDVHIIGWGLNKIYDNDSTLAMYWKNGERIRLKATASYEMIESINVSGNDVYFAGHAFNRDDENRIISAKLWKNGVATALTRGGVDSFASKVEVDGNDVYVAGKNGTQAVYWKNGIMKTLETGAISSSEVNGLAVVHGELVISGRNYDDRLNYQGSFVWKNGQLQAPFMGNNFLVSIDGIAPAK
jgi:hypothetical protein